MMTPEIAALRIGRVLQASETGIDGTITQLSRLLGELTAARIETDTPAATGQRALARLAAAQVKLVEARGDVVRAHEDLRRIAETADIPTSCPDTVSATLEDAREAA